MLLLLLQIDGLGSVDPAERAAARAAIERRYAGEVKEIKKLDTDEAAVILGVLGEKSARTRLSKLTDAAALEALSIVGPTGGASALGELLASGDDAVALAAARALGAFKGGVAELEKRRKKAGSKREGLLAFYGLQTAEPGDVSSLMEMLDDPTARLVALNLPAARDRIRFSWDETANKRAGAVRAKFDAGDAGLGLLLWRSSAIAYSDVLGLLKSKTPALADWAVEAAGKPWRRSTLIEAIVQAMEAGEDARYEELFEKATGFRAKEEKYADRVKAYRAEWENRRVGTIDADVGPAIADGAAFLRSRMQADGTWDYCSCGFPAYAAVDHTTGTTALALYTLLKCDVPRDDPALAGGFKHILEVKLDALGSASTYTVALIAMALAEALQPVKRDGKTVAIDRAQAAAMNKRIQECADWLVAAQLRVGDGGAEYESGPWTYNKTTVNTTHDNSNTQFAVLGLAAARNGGAEIAASAWRRALNHYRGQQYDDGGWPYQDAQSTTKVGRGSMTGGGISSTLLCEAALRNRKAEDLAADDATVKKALGFFEKSYPFPTPSRNEQTGHVFSIYYDYYSVERAMMTAGFKRLAEKDWYHDGAHMILYNQLDDGSWMDVTDTCFALLFLKRAYVTVATR